MDERDLGGKCGERYLTVYRLPNNIWHKISDKVDDSGLLCPSCVDIIAREKGINLYWEATEWEYPTQNILSELENMIKEKEW